MERNRRNESSKGNMPIVGLGKCLLLSYVLTVLLLLLLALLLYRLDLAVKIVSVGIIVIYVAASFLVGFLAGKKMGSRKFLWGLLMGSVYFLVLALVSVAVNHSAAGVADNFLKVYIICAGSGMLGGMLG